VTRPRPRAGNALTALELALAAALLALLIGWRDLPLVDLPQHAVQLANWLSLDRVGKPDALELNFRTPYLLAYPAARALAPLVGVLVALKLVFWASIVLQARALRHLCETLGYEPGLGLLGYALGLGYSFCWGFISFCAALPLVYLAFAFAAQQHVNPNWRSTVALGTTLALTLVAHGVAFGFTLAVLLPILLLGGGRFWQRLLPLAMPLALAALWLLPRGSSTRLGGDLWRFEPERLLELPGQLVGIGAADSVSSALGLLVLVCVAANLGKSRGLLRALPLAGVLLGYAFFPTMFRGAGPLGPRFGSLLVPALLLAFEPRAAVSLPWRRACAALSLACLGVWALRLPGFNQELAELRQVLTRMEPGFALRPLVFERESRAFPGNPAHLHAPAYYALERGGDAGYSFAMYSISVVRFRPGVPIKMGGGAEWNPQSFDAARELDDYDYFLVRSSTDPGRILFGDGTAVRLEHQVGHWWCYRKRAQ
jgi:hypothetical protein